LKSYVHSAAIFGGTCHSFRRALSSVVSLYSAAGVDPNPLKPIFNGLVAAVGNFSETCLLTGNFKILNVSESNFMLTPSVRENCVSRNSLIEEFFKLQSGGMK
jgi:hypothetical protein